jgi:hypothetical protein
MASHGGSADGVLHERHQLPDAQIGVASLRLDANDQPGAGRQLLRRGRKLDAIVGRDIVVRVGALNSAPAAD